jgi:hypothetical protein
MKIINFYFIESELNAIVACFLLFIFIFSFLFFYSIDYEKRILLFLSIGMIAFSIPFTIKLAVNTNPSLVIEYVNDNVNGNQINISKEQIINDILNGKMIQNKNNMKVYSQEIKLTKEEYEKLSKYKEEYDKKLENGNVNIVD